LLEVRDVQVSLGAETLDPRLADLRLADRLRAIALRAVDEAGRSIEEPLAIALRDGRAVASAKGAAGRVRIDAALDPGVELLVTAAGYRPTPLDVPTGGEEPVVVLRAGIPVRLRSSVRPPTEAGGNTAQLSFRRVAPVLDESGAFDLEVPLELALDGEAAVVFPGPGTYRLGLSKRRRAADGTHYQTWPGYEAGAPELEIREADARGLLAFDLPAAIIPD
jgi:hypothetical protein